jgi:alpha-glucosidase
MLVTMLRGTPFVFQGEELGLPDAKVPPGRVVDLDGRDPERAPIPWAPGEGAGFTTGTPWLPFVEEAERLNVATQAEDPASTLSFARRLRQLRREEAALHGGAQRSVDAAPELFCFTRDDRFLVALNFSSAEVPLSLAGDLGQTAQLELSTDAARELGDVVLGDLVLRPDEGVLLRLR